MDEYTTAPLLDGSLINNRKRSAPSVVPTSSNDTSEEPLGKRLRTEDVAVCDKCAKVNFLKLFTKAGEYHLGTLERERLNRNCRLCRLVMRTVKKAYPNLLIAANVLWEDILDSDVEYKIYSRQAKTSSADRAYVCTIDLRFENWGQNRPSKPPILDHNFDTMSFHLVGDLQSKIKRDGNPYCTRREMPPCLDIGWLRNWLDVCDTSHFHPCCLLDWNSPLKEGLLELQQKNRFRLIDVSTLMVTPVIQTTLPKYFALSYLWGDSMREYVGQEYGEGPAKTQDIPLLDLDHAPTIIYDAVTLVRRLGERYLWVDSICIVQSDPQDKADNIAKMGDIYHYAYATIIGAAGNSDVGLTRLHGNEQSDDSCATFWSAGNSVSLLPVREDLENGLKRTTWNKRGWTYQEGLLSQRHIYFFKDEVICQCRRSTVREAYDLEIFSNRKTSELLREDKDETAKIWTHISTTLAEIVHFSKFDWKDFSDSVSLYSRRNLTYESDRLNGFLGIFNRLVPSPKQPAKIISDRLLNGLPQAWFHQALLWYPGEPQSVFDYPPMPGRIKGKVQNGYVLPTWSWAAWEGPVAFSFMFCKDKNIPEPHLWQLDSQNIVLGPIGKAKKTGGWETWDALPEPCEQTDPPQITLHMKVPVITCCLEYFDDGARLRPNQAETGNTHDPGDFVAHLRVGDAMVDFMRQPEKKVYDLAVLPFCKGSMRNLLPAIILERQHGFMERLPVAIQWVKSQVVKNVATVKHVRLR